MKINFVLNSQNANWILEKFAHRTTTELIKLGHDARINPEPIQNFDINHYLSYNFVLNPPPNSTVLVTHIDDRLKLQYLKNLSKNQNIASLICLSRYTKNFLISEGLPKDRISSVPPSVDTFPPVRVIRIGLSSYIYKDGRKNESWLQRLCDDISLAGFEFHVFGSGWEKTCERLLESGAIVRYTKATADFTDDHRAILDSLKVVDYWMYLGFDEGSMGCLDAALAGVPLITTPQGFHLDLPGGIAHEISSYEALKSLLTQLKTRFLSENEIHEYYSWKRYAQECLTIWEGDYGYSSKTLIKIGESESKSTEFTSPLVRMSFKRYKSAIGRLKLVIRIRKRVNQKRKL